MAQLEWGTIPTGSGYESHHQSWSNGLWPMWDQCGWCCLFVIKSVLIKCGINMIGVVMACTTMWSKLNYINQMVDLVGQPTHHQPPIILPSHHYCVCVLYVPYLLACAPLCTHRHVGMHPSCGHQGLPPSFLVVKLVGGACMRRREI